MRYQKRFLQMLLYKLCNLLESNLMSLIIVLESWKIDEAFKNKLFVAITRAKENVYIYYAERFAGKEFVTNLLK